MTLSVALITHNEEANLARTLASVRWAHQIVVVDSHSTDSTVAIAHSFGATVLVRDWPGFAAQKNFALAQCTGDWILSLDADEELTPELQHELQTLLATEPPADAYYLKRRNLFLGRWMRHGGFYPDAKLRLFRRVAGSHATALRFTSRAVHETIPAPPGAPTLSNDLLHHAYPTLTAYIEHMNRYSSLGAEVLLGARPTGDRFNTSLPVFLLRAFVAPVLMFVKNYIVRAGFLDGREGLLLHRYQAEYASWKYTKAWEQSRKIK